MAQLIPIVSEALQSTVRRLLPSQQGFGEDLQAQNVIVPIIDLTPTAEGSLLGTNLQTAFSFDDVNTFSAINGSDVVANNAGFWRIIAAISIRNFSGANPECSFSMSNGLSTKTLITWSLVSTSQESPIDNNIDFVVYLNSGESISANSNSGESKLIGSCIQIADSNGNLSNPAGFVSQ